MTPREIRIELLRHHLEIRAQIGEAMRVVEEGRDRLDVALERLAETVRAHTRREEEVLERILPFVAEWGPARTDMVLEEHEREHDEIHDALAAVVAAEDVEAALEELVDQILEHMEEEERTFLAEAVLRDAPQVEVAP